MFVADERPSKCWIQELDGMVDMGRMGTEPKRFGSSWTRRFGTRVPVVPPNLMQKVLEDLGVTNS